MLPSDNGTAQAIVTLMQKFGWRRIAILTEDGSLFTEVRKTILYDDVAFCNCIPAVNLWGLWTDTWHGN